MKSLTPVIVFPVIGLLGMGCAALYLQNHTLKTELAALQQSQASKEAAHARELENVRQAQVGAAPQQQRSVQNPLANAEPCEPSDNGEQADYVQGAEAFHIEQAVNKKYAGLLERLRLGGAKEAQLLALLAQRERVLNATTHSYFTDALDSELSIQERDAQLASLDDQIEAVLPPENQDTYELLKDSEFEQYQLQEFDNNLPADQFLTEQQAQELLLTKLNHKQEFSRAVQSASQMIKQGNRAGFDLLDQAIQNYKVNYLAEVQDELSEFQFTKLREYEDKNFNEIRDSLRAAYLYQLED